jgi:hypothetical protein
MRGMGKELRLVYDIPPQASSCCLGSESPFPFPLPLEKSRGIAERLDRARQVCSFYTVVLPWGTGLASLIPSIRGLERADGARALCFYDLPRSRATLVQPSSLAKCPLGRVNFRARASILT